MFWRIRCHFCGTRQPHFKSVTNFQCNTCEAVNYLDGKGNIIDTPATVASPPPESTEQKPFLSFTHQLPESLQHQARPSFCSVCQQNQHLYNAILAEYLPDEDHPTYQKKLKALPEYKKELEKRYPLVCKQCAPMVQGKINRADYYGMTRNAAKRMAATKASGGRSLRTRDDWWKKFMRNLLRLIGFVLYLGLFAQVAFHIYGIISTWLSTPPVSDPELVDEAKIYFAPTLMECAQQAKRFTFDTTCFHYFSTLIPRALALAGTFIWFNPGIKAWYHHTRRIEAVHGQNNYFYMQIIILAIRSIAWYTVSDAKFLEKFEKQQIVAIHAFAILFMLMTQAAANRSIKLQNWKMRGQVMPKPEEIDILSADAADVEQHFTSKPSSKDPWKYLRREEKPPLDINSLAPKSQQPILRPTNGMYQPPPSPEFSDYDDEDAMETDFRPVMRSSQRLNMQNRPRLEPTHTYMNHRNTPPLSFGDVRNGLSGVEYQMRADEQRQQQEQQQKFQYQPVQKSPFYGKLPEAPMSMERRLRNPVLRPAEPEKQIPLSQQKDFMNQMRRGVKPVQFPEKGSNFELKKGTWTLPSDKKELGFEDRFMNTFSLADGSPAAQKKGMFGLW